MRLLAPVTVDQNAWNNRARPERDLRAAGPTGKRLRLFRRFTSPRLYRSHDVHGPSTEVRRSAKAACTSSVIGKGRQ
ncbi:hypothetical protein chiPu_0031324 [Chiloscyllium punctatum]|uniref:Uncharacterized protein n=1 Tax=Chiloscyllium punctatum TaxID=137246 RepID=A0A401TWZ4_CHIPU|nr:hypothetical protein [Chiloscyllium punctatum]